MPTFDGEALVITLDAVTPTLDAEADLYGEWKTWMLAGNMRYPQAFRTTGGDSLTPGVDAGAYFFIQNQLGWRIKPAEEDATILLTGNLAPEDSTLPVLIPTTGDFTVLVQGIQPITQGIGTIKDTLDFASYNGQVTVDTTSMYSGTSGNIGNLQFPVNNLDDALIIAAREGLEHLHIEGDLLNITQDVSGYIISGDSSNVTLLEFVAGCITNDTSFVKLCIKGALSGTGMSYSYCDFHPDGVTGIEGQGSNTGFAGAGPYVLGGVTTLVDPFTIRAEGSLRPVIDVNGQDSLALRGYLGPFEITGTTAATSTVCVDLISSYCILQAGNTDGLIILRGGGHVSNMSNGSSVYDNTVPVLSYENLERTVWLDETLIPVGDGTQKTPFNTLTAAIDWGEANGVRTVIVTGDVILDRQLKNFIFKGIGHPTIDCNSQDLAGSVFETCQMDGTYTGVISADRCRLKDNFYLNGNFDQCKLDGDLFGVDGGSALMSYCVSAKAGLARPTINMTSTTGFSLIMRKNGGGITIKGCDHASSTVTVEVSEGSLTFDASNTTTVANSMVARGDCKFVDSVPTAGVTVDETSAKLTWSHLIEAGFTAEEIMRVQGAAMAGNASGLDTNNPIYQALNGSKPRIATTGDGYGNRTGTVIDASY